MTSTVTMELMLELEDVLETQIDVEEIEPADLASLGALADFGRGSHGGGGLSALYVTGSGEGRTGLADGTITLGSARWQNFPDSSQRAFDPGYLEFLGDLVQPHGLPLHLDSGGEHTYGEMLSRLIGDLVPPDSPRFA
jgi:hypothetical protein